jgi:hypothetical protein
MSCGTPAVNQTEPNVMGNLPVQIVCCRQRSPKMDGAEVDEGGFAESGHSSVVEVINIGSFETAFLKERIERKISCRSIHPQLIVMPMIICFFCFLNAVMRGNSLDCSDYCLGPFESRGNS